MKVIIDIDENVYTRLFDNGIEDSEIVSDDLVVIAKAIRKGEILQSEPCEDCISREAVLKIAQTSKSNWIDNSVLYGKVKALPSVQPKTEQEPKTEWIPVSEGLPKVNQPVYITYRWRNKNIFYPIPCILCDNGLWYTDRDSLINNDINLDDYDDGTDQPFVCEIVAWMPLPPSYQGK